MGFKNIKANQGFTIVELLIVVVVIAILAAITIVSYNGITNQANASAAKSTAASVQKKIELYFAEKSSYPTAKTDLTTASDSGKSYYLPSTTLKLIATPEPTTGKDTVRIQNCTTSGMVIGYWDYEAKNVATINIGNPGTCTTAWS
jgi:prepilin-type N-terminal cleavage/methylation domain-containing protein